MPSSRGADYRVGGQYEYIGIVYSAAQPDVDINMADSFTPFPGDVLLASYPKTGSVLKFDKTE